MSEDEWKYTLSTIDALWVHDDNPKRPHALLTSGLHSNGFVNMTLMTQNPILLATGCEDLNKKLEEYAIQNGVNLDFSWIIGSAYGSITLASRLAETTGFAKAGFTEKEGTAADAPMKLNRFDVPQGASALTVEDVLTTGGTVLKTILECESKGIIVVSPIVSLVNRSGKKEFNGRATVSLLDIALNNWTAEECPLCKAGSEAVRPKASDNWARLNAKY